MISPVPEGRRSNFTGIAEDCLAGVLAVKQRQVVSVLQG
jgi:hypothetical protein